MLLNSDQLQCDSVVATIIHNLKVKINIDKF